MSEDDYSTEKQEPTLEEALKVLQREREKRLIEFWEKVQALEEEYGVALDVQSKIVLRET